MILTGSIYSTLSNSVPENIFASRVLNLLLEAAELSPQRQLSGEEAAAAPRLRTHSRDGAPHITVPSSLAPNMKIKRQKTAKKLLAFYKYNYGFREPFQILLDGTFCQAALKNKIQIKEQMPKYLMGEVQLCTTSCVLKELQSLGKELYGAKLIAQRFQARNCSHLKKPVGASMCLLSMVENNNPHHYFVATQDQDLTVKIKKMSGVPLMYIIQNTMVLEKPSSQSIAQQQSLYGNQFVPVHQQQTIQHLKEEQGLVKESEPRSKKRKRKGGPNPLSCLKKKAQPPQQPSKEKKRRRARKKKRITVSSVKVESTM